MYLEVYRKFINYRVRLVGGNGEVMMVSEAYYSKGNAQRAAETISAETGLPIK